MTDASTDTEMLQLRARLAAHQCSCVISNGGSVRTFTQRGVADLHALLHTEPEFLRSALIADKVIGKGAAAIMCAGKVARVHAPVISTPAMALLRNYGIHAECDTEVPYIINRAGTGQCPLEQLCHSAATAEECLPIIDKFVAGLKHREKSEQNN